MSIHRTCALAAAVAVVGAVTSTAYAAAPPYTIPLPYNSDIVREVGGTTTHGVALDGGAFVTQSYAAANDATDPRGLPDDGLFSGNGATLQLGPYNGNNALRLAPGETSATFDVPDAQYDWLHVYMLAGDGYMDTFVGGPTPVVRTVDRTAVPLQIFHTRVGSSTGIIGGLITNVTEDPAAATYLADAMDLSGAGGNGFADIDDAAIFRFSYGVGSTSNPPSGAFRFFHFGAERGIGGPSDGPIYILGAQLDSGPIPEPATGALIALSLAGLAVRRSRRGA